jgi:DNA ligase D-like protein (predicted 3'-phosphoesterase)
MNFQQNHEVGIQRPLFPPQSSRQNSSPIRFGRALHPIRSTNGHWPRNPSYYDSPCSLKLHRAGKNHLDLRLCHHWIASSWALYSFPSHCPERSCVAIQVEDHLRENILFEGVHPEGKRGAGPVIVVSRGSWRPLPEYLDIGESRRLGCLRFLVDSERMRGIWSLIRNEIGVGIGNPRWTLTKEPDEFAMTKDPMDTTDWTKLTSCLTGLTLEEMERNWDLGVRPYRACRSLFTGWD